MTEHSSILRQAVQTGRGVLHPNSVPRMQFFLLGIGAGLGMALGFSVSALLQLGAPLYGCVVGAVLGGVVLATGVFRLLFVVDVSQPSYLKEFGAPPLNDSAASRITQTWLSP